MLALVGACGGEETARREDHRAFAATDHAVSFLSLARTITGETLASWIEETESGDVVLWTDPTADEDVLHQAILGPHELHWIPTPLLATDAGFARLVRGSDTFAELHIGLGGALGAYRPAFALADVSPPFRAVGLSAEVVLLATEGLNGPNLWVPSELDWSIEKVVAEASCLAAGTSEPMPFGAAAWQGDAVVVVDLETDDTCVARLHVVSLAGGVDADHDVTGSVYDPETGDPSWLVADVVTLSPSGAVAVLWLSLDGRARVHAMGAPGPFDLDAPVYDAGGAAVTDARLLATTDRFVFTYRLDEGGVTSPTQAVVINPFSPAASAPFRWPVDDAECADLVGLPIRNGVQYACVAPCEGVGCREHWIYGGRVVLP